jgi:hypothetical protein
MGSGVTGGDGRRPTPCNDRPPRGIRDRCAIRIPERCRALLIAGVPCTGLDTLHVGEGESMRSKSAVKRVADELSRQGAWCMSSPRGTGDRSWLR